jgi:hypothetical protein
MDSNFYEREALLSMPFVLIVVYKKGSMTTMSPLHKKILLIFGFNFEHQP